MNYQPTENETWAQTLLFIVYQPMVAQKTGRYPLRHIIDQFPPADRAKVTEGIDAFAEMGVLAKDGGYICITDKSEALFQGIDHIASQPADAVQQVLRDHPALSSILAKINNDLRFIPPDEVRKVAAHGDSFTNARNSVEGKPVSSGAVIFYALFGVLVLIGLINMIIKRML